MRIAIVSAHYPPNFVSGGTLVPQRSAGQLAARGHSVFVFAGEMRPGHADLLTRVESPEAHGGIEVTWVSLAGRLRWERPENYQSTGVQSIFLDFLRRVRPDVVHFHTLQGLGGGLVPLAAASGAATVITMHDMWWWCARQFLVQEDLQPCSTVVDAGVCPCSVDNIWLRERDAELAAHLATADLVLAPSRPMLTLLSSNGVDPARLALDENPSPDAIRTAVPRTQRSTGSPVRFVFAGGRFPLKGGPLALAAAQQLQGLPGWSLDMFGAATRGALPAQVRVLPPYRADEVGDVLADYDVLLMSSVMLESYSLLTREAIAAGLVVVTGDNPGPVEVVRDGVNGLVVPRGNVPALAAAMRSLVENAGLLERLRPVPGSLTLRTLDEQAAGLESAYRRILAGRDQFPPSDPESGSGSARDRPAGPRAPADRSDAVPDPPPRMQSVLIVSGITGAPLRYRGYLPAEALATLGITVEVKMYRDLLVPDAAAEADAVVFYRVPATTQVLELIAHLRARTPAVPILFDIDDLVVDPGLAPELDPILLAVPGMDLDLYWQGVRRYRTTLEACDGYIGSTRYLCQAVGVLTGLPTYRFANGVGRELARAADAQLRRPRARGPLRLGYFSGTNTHNQDWAFVEPAIVELLDNRPGVHLWIGGMLETTEALLPYAGRIRRLPTVPWYELPAVLRDVDVNLAPLEPGRTFNEAKSAIKYLEAALVGTPTVASPSEPFQECISNGRNGFLAADHQEWVSALWTLLDDAGLRGRMGLAAREQVLTTLSPAQQGHRYRDILLQARDRAASEGHREQFRSWAPVALDEPYMDAPTDYYGPLEIRPGGRVRPGNHRGPVELAAYYAGATREMLTSDGLAATARRAAEVARRLTARSPGGFRR